MVAAAIGLPEVVVTVPVMVNGAAGCRVKSALVTGTPSPMVAAVRAGTYWDAVAEIW